MVFSSSVFIYLFFPITLFLYYITSERYKNIILLILSLIFYSWGEPKYIFLMLTFIGVNFIGGILIEELETNYKLKKLAIILFLGINLGILIVFKYSNFLIDNLNIVLSFVNIGTIQIKKILLPIGVSFITFHTMSYVIDVYRGKVKAQRNIINLALYISLFPQLVAGPIIRYHNIQEQIHKRSVTLENMSDGITRFIIGLGKKIIIANNVGFIANQIFDISANRLGSGVAWLGIICYTLQIYYDFSGYSDMAIGIGKMFGFEFSENFKYPYIAIGIEDFWRRWHISLSSWFKDYLYIPLGGNRKGKTKTYINLLIVFFCTGIWHGASWNFVVWGLFHGFFITMEKAKIIDLDKLKFNSVKYVYTILVFMIGWVFFRADNVTYAIEFIKAMFRFNSSYVDVYSVFAYIDNQSIIILLLGFIGVTPIVNNMMKGFKLRRCESLGFNTINMVYVYLVFIISLVYLASETYNPFIYFRF